MFLALEALSGGVLLTKLQTWLQGYAAPQFIAVPLTNATVTVFDRGADVSTATPVPVYADSTGTGTPLTQPLQPDADGRLPGFVAQPRPLDLWVQGPGIVSRRIAIGFDEQLAPIALLPSGSDDTAAINDAIVNGRKLGPGTFLFSGLISGIPSGAGSSETTLKANGPGARMQIGDGYGGRYAGAHNPIPHAGGRYGGFTLDGDNVAPYIPAPAAPNVAVAGTGGTVPAGTYKVAVTYVNRYGETAGSAITTVTAPTNTSKLTITAPAPMNDAMGWYAYVSQAGGNSLTRQQAAGSPTEMTVDLVIGAAPTSTGVAVAGLANTFRGVLFVDSGQGLTFIDIQVVNSVGDAHAVYGQNETYIQCSFAGNNVDGNGTVLDNGTGGNVFLRVEWPGAKNFDVEVRQTLPTSELVGYVVPENNYWYGCILESSIKPRAPLHVSAGVGNVFSETTFTDGTECGALVEQGLPYAYPNFCDQTIFRNCAWNVQPGGPPGLKSGTAPFFGFWPVILQGHQMGNFNVEWHSATALRDDGLRYWQGSGSYYTGLDNAASTPTRGLLAAEQIGQTNGVAGLDGQSKVAVSKTHALTPYEQNVLAEAGLLAYWPLGDASTTAIEYVAEHNGSYNAQCQRAQAGLLWDNTLAVDVSTANALVALGGVLPSQPTTAITLEAWIHPASMLANGSYEAILSNWYAGTDGWALNLYVLGGVAYPALSLNGTNCTGPGGVATGSTVHLVGTWDGTTMTLYINGAAVATQAFAGPITYAGGLANNPTVGTHVNSAAQGLPGRVAHAAVYNKALSAARVAKHYAFGTTG